MTHPYLLQPLTAEESIVIRTIAKKIAVAVGNSDQDLTVQALAFTLLGAVELTYELSSQEAIDFCADCIRRYGQEWRKIHEVRS